jgi:hypothetical protein
MQEELCRKLISSPWNHPDHEDWESYSLPAQAEAIRRRRDQLDAD